MTPGTNIVRRLAACMATLAALAPALAPALEIGPIEARSALYEPLDARIPVQDARSGDLEGLNVTLGSPAQFELAGVARLQHLDLLEFVVVAEGEDGGYIHVRTAEPIIEPSLTFLIDVDWPRGRTVRGYKLHLVSAAGSAPARTAPRAEPAAQPETDPPPAASVSEPAPSGAAYGPVRESETLWSIASTLRPDTSISPQRMMLAILEANPEAFALRNVNALRAGATLRIPSRDEIGPDELHAAIAEVERQHAAWREHRESASTRAVPEPAPADSAMEQGGRIEVVSPETPTETTAGEDGADDSALRRELALAMEEADAVRRENDELKLRLADAENRMGELNRLVELKNDEIAGLQLELSVRSESTPAPGEAQPIAGTRDQVDELSRLVELKNEEIAALRAELSASTEATPATAAEPAAVEQTPQPAPGRAEPATAAEAEPRSLPFGLGALPVNPVFLVGGAGLLLLLLGVLALLRRRRASAEAEEDFLEAAEASPAEEDGLLHELEAVATEEDGLLHELEAVAAELADEPGDSRDRRPDRPVRSVSAATAAATAVSDGDAEQRSRNEDMEGPERLVEARIAELWRDEDDDRNSEGAFLADTDVEDDSAETTFDIDDLAVGDSGRDTEEDGPGDGFGIPDTVVPADTDVEYDSEEITFDLDDLAADDPLRGMEEGGPGDGFGISDAAMERETDPLETVPPRTDDEEGGGLDRAAGRLVPAPATVIGDAPGRDSGVPDDGWQDAKLVPAGERAPVDAEPGVFEATDESAGRSAGMSAEGSVDSGREPRDADAPGPPSASLPGEPADGGGTHVLPLEEVGEDEVQTKIDLAQVYMEMGDAESARGFLEAVLAEGDAEQREAAREMLAKLA
ncbi:MAG: hypothetical protein OXI15_01340 [Chromatiales bacterium]|nr:hypothetical protein [Chromatiales bacterium]